MTKLECYYWSYSLLKFEHNHPTTYSNRNNYFFLYYSPVRVAWFAYTNLKDLKGKIFNEAFANAEYSTYRYLQTLKHTYCDAKFDELLYELETISRFV